MTKQFQIILKNEGNDNDYITLETYETLESAEYMLKWYETHKRFFNGTFEIIEN